MTRTGAEGQPAAPTVQHGPSSCLEVCDRDTALRALFVSLSHLSLDDSGLPLFDDHNLGNESLDFVGFYLEIIPDS